ncbi:MAG: hypothetical protein AAGA55_09915, partial [Planctomycetota bacterium]
MRNRQRASLPRLAIIALAASVVLAFQAADGLAAPTSEDLSGLKTTASLDPDQPSTYLAVGEHLARLPESLELGRQVLATGALIALEPAAPRGGVLETGGDHRRIAASLVIALAGIAETADARRGLWMLALSIDPGRSESFRWLGRSGVLQEAQSDEAARVLAQLRRNDPDGPAAWAMC